MSDEFRIILDGTIMQSYPDLLLVAHAHGDLALHLGPLKRRQKHGREDGNDGDDDEHLDQGEP